jgi:hydroxymethylglutaryl-CoA synthase
MFSYGSGLAASMFLIKGRASTTSIAANLQIESRLKSRVKVSPEEYARIMLEREQAYGTLKEGPLRVNLDRLFEGTYYVSNIDAKWKRTYTRLG